MFIAFKKVLRMQIKLKFSFRAVLCSREFLIYSNIILVLLFLSMEICEAQEILSSKGLIEVQRNARN